MAIKYGQLLTVEELIKELDKYNHKELHVHHTWKPAHSSFKGANHLSIQDGMRNYHINTNKWDAIAQHVTLFPDGKFMVGRDFGKSPISISGKNTGSFAVEMVGNFDKLGDKGALVNTLGYDKFEGKQREAMLKLAHYFDVKRGKYVRFHRENASKTCPGTTINKDVFMSDARKIYDEVKPVVVKKDYEGHWAEKEIKQIIEAKIMTGRDVTGNFQPDAPITRAEIAVVASRIISALKQ